VRQQFVTSRQRYTVCRGAPKIRATSGGLLPASSSRPARTRRFTAWSSLGFVMRLARHHNDIDIAHDSPIGCHEVSEVIGPSPQIARKSQQPSLRIN